MVNFRKVLYKYLKEVIKNHPEIITLPDKLPEFKEWEDYVHKIAFRGTRIEETLEQLKHILIYLGHFPETPRYKKSGITRTKYAQYHLENFLARYYSIFDKCLLLINDIFFLGIDPRYCNFKEVKKKLKKIGDNSKYIKNIKRNLGNIYEIIKPFKVPRDRNIHRGIFDGGDRFLGIHLINEVYLKNPNIFKNVPFAEPPREAVRMVTNDWLKQEIDRHNKDIKIIEKKIGSLFDNLIEGFAKISEGIKKSEQK